MASAVSGGSSGTGGAPPPAPGPGAPKLARVVDLRPGHAPHVNTQVILLEKAPARETPGHPPVSLALCADHTAAVGLQLWGEEVAAFQPGDVLRLTGGMFNFATARKLSQPLLKAGRHGTLEKVGEFTAVFSEAVNMSQVKWVNRGGSGASEAWEPLDPQVLPQKHWRPPAARAGGAGGGSEAQRPA